MGQNGERFVAALYHWNLAGDSLKRKLGSLFPAAHHLWVESKCLDARLDGWWKKAGNLVIRFS